jgi:para-nitrobenzyl esterase
VGDLRFRRAVECEPWKEVKKLYSFWWSFLSINLFFYLRLVVSNDTEDCHYLNTWRKNNDIKKLPIVVWSHRGYLHYCSATNVPYDGDNFVSFEYRLGPLGCYNFSIYNKEALNPNCCLSDETLALKWVKENIEAFSGDPNNITINGESAGGASVLALMTYPLVKRLFQKAICQSGYPDGQYSEKSNKLLINMFFRIFKY